MRLYNDPMQSAPSHDTPILVAALYHFAAVPKPEELRADLFTLLDSISIRGLILVAQEGVNGTIAGTSAAIEKAVAFIRAQQGFAKLDVKYSGAATMPFPRLNVRVKSEIVTLGVDGVDPVHQAGEYVTAQEWNALISDPDTIVIDTRNDYEVAIGTFAGAINPHTQGFREFPSWFRSERDKLLGEGKEPKVAMFCTGGIRCEKSTAFLKQEGVEQVFHLQGGILKYLEEVPESDSLWEGECFVFDQRVSVGHGLAQGSYSLCFACRAPVAGEDKLSPAYEEGVSCPACHAERTEEQRAAYRERQLQADIAAKQGKVHIGAKRS